MKDEKSDSRSARKQGGSLTYKAGDFPIVGIGASAGGLETFTELLRYLPENSGMAFILIQHLDPKHESVLANLLGKTTKMSVGEVKNGTMVEANKVYVIPPNTNMAILGRVLHLMPREETPRWRMPIDYFFRSLAEDAGSKAIGIVLSGTGSDGTGGLKAVKAEGGITFAQDPGSAKYDGMPIAAINAGVVDFILPPEGIAGELIRIGNHPYLTLSADKVAELPKFEEDLLQKIYILLRSATGVDFSNYKQSTIKRRIVRRMVIYKLDKLSNYVDYLYKNPGEINNLFDDILISVTSFFRDPQIFETLKAEVFPVIARGKTIDEPIRIWVPGCSTGEEVYSIAISLLEYLESSMLKPLFQIFATDINAKALEKARRGIYEENIANNVSKSRLKQYFTQVEGGFRINQGIREMCVFAIHDVARDSPFSRMDLISCRNLLIYFSLVLQKKVIPIFHYALKPTGYLLLGTAENVGRFTDLFRIIDPGKKFYAKKQAPFKVTLETVATGIPLEEAVPGTAVAKRPVRPDVKTKKQYDVLKEADRTILSRYSPPGVVIDEDLQILQFRGRTGLYLEPAPGKASLNITDMVREGLTIDLRTAIQKAKQTKSTVKKKNIRIKYNDDYREINLEVIPLINPSGHFNFLILFYDVTPQTKIVGLKNNALQGKQERKSQEVETDKLRQELTESKEYLRSIVEEKETSNEELRAANEEIQSSNEELQSINEELETAKEELQSNNEELTTVNDELQNRNLDLSRAYDDINNLLASANIPMLILSDDLRIRRFTPVSQRLINVIPTDIGRPITDIRLKVDIPDLEKLILEVVDTMTVKEIEIRDDEGRWYAMRMLPFKTAEKKIEGIIITFLDINDIKLRLEEVSESSRLRDALNRINLIIYSRFDFDEIMQSVVANGAKAIESDASGIALLEDNRWVIRYAYEFTKGVTFTDAQLPHAAEAIRTGKPVIISDAYQDGRVSPEVMKTLNSRSVLIVPLIVKEETIGVLFYNYHSAPTFFSDAYMDFATKLGASISLAIENARLLNETRAKGLSDTLNEINASVMSTLDFDSIIKPVTDKASQAINCISSGIVIKENGYWILKSAYGLPWDAIGYRFNKNDISVTINALKTAKKPFIIKDAATDGRITPELIKQFNAQSVLIAPLMIGEEITGVIAFNFSSVSSITELVEDFAQKFSYTVSLAHVNARLYSEERSIAVTLQQSFISVPSKIDKIDVGHAYHASTLERGTVGGDFYEIFEVDDKLIGIVVGDVAGKGIEAASITSMIKNCIKAYAFIGLSPGDVIAKTNDITQRVTAPEMFATVFYCLLDRDSGAITYCSAGHPTSFIRKRTEKKVDFLANGSPAIGAFANVEFVENTGTLEKGDILVTYTDGVTEARRGKELFGDKRLIGLIRSLHEPNANDIARKVFDEVFDFSNGKLADDVAVLTISLV